jgi:hypothetical protein
VLRLVLGELVARRGWVRWKLDPNMIQDASLKTQIQQQWDMWKLHKPHYPNANLWWDWYVKKQMQQYLWKLEAEHRREHKIMEDHLYHCIYDIQQSDLTPETKLAALNWYKANLVHLQVDEWKN